MPNQLAGSTSPYLLQHQNNPVDWYPWCDAAFEKAEREDKPLFLSVGYSACHWCHVMEHESFENETIAAFLNEHFVSVKVDREQRPDIDQIYMQVVQWMTGSGGWPMSVFLTPQAEPFYAGTYWPPRDAFGRPGFDTVLNAIVNAWRDKRNDLVTQADSIVKQLQISLGQTSNERSSQPTFSPEDARHILAASDSVLTQSFDGLHGGFGNAPKFPHATDLTLLLRLERRMPSTAREQILRTSLDRMADGGIYDHLGGGFARYSVDREWLVPHFEKMLYDNALLAKLYTEAYRWSKDEYYKKVACETLDYILRELTDQHGGFYSAEDADSEGVEGKFYVWSLDEIRHELGDEEAAVFAAYYNVTSQGNFEGHNILHRRRSERDIAQELKMTTADLAQRIANSKEKLHKVRAKRVRPGLDDKVLVGWNALVIDAMCLAAIVFDDTRYLDGARRAVEFIFNELRDEAGRLHHVWRRGHAEIPAFLDDTAAFAGSLLSLWESTGDGNYLQLARNLAEMMIDDFSAEQGGFYFTSKRAEQLIARNMDHFDGSTPSGNGLAVTLLVRLWWWTGEEKFRKAAEAAFAMLAPTLHDNHGGGNQTAIAMDHWLGPVAQWTFVSSNSQSIARVRAAFYKDFRANMLLACLTPNSTSHHVVLHPVFDHTTGPGGDDILYVCEGFTCQQPIVGLEKILDFIAKHNYVGQTKS